MLRNPKTLKAAARDSLGSAGYDPKKLALIYSGATLLLSLLVMLVDYLLAQELSATVGLGGMDKRAALETAQSLLQLTPLFLLLSLFSLPQFHSLAESYFRFDCHPAAILACLMNHLPNYYLLLHQLLAVFSFQKSKK